MSTDDGSWGFENLSSGEALRMTAELWSFVGIPLLVLSLNRLNAGAQGAVSDVLFSATLVVAATAYLYSLEKKQRL